MNKNLFKYAITLGMGLFLQVAQANTIFIVDASGTEIREGNSAGAMQYNASCGGGDNCMQAFFGVPGLTAGSDVGFSFTTGTGTNIGNSGNNELPYLNQLLVEVGSQPVGLDTRNQVKTEAMQFTTSRQYFSIKKGDWTVYFENLSDTGTLVVDFDPADFSHWTEYGADVIVTDPPEVPLPAAAWLFGSALLGLVTVARRRKAKV